MRKREAEEIVLNERGNVLDKEGKEVYGQEQEEEVEKASTGPSFLRRIWDAYNSKSSVH